LFFMFNINESYYITEVKKNHNNNNNKNN